mgnify:CR=1 FL=1
MPGANHVHCAICRQNFKDYYQHVFSKEHSNELKKDLNFEIFKKIDIVI